METTEAVKTTMENLGYEVEKVVEDVDIRTGNGLKMAAGVGIGVAVGVVLTAISKPIIAKIKAKRYEKRYGNADVVTDVEFTEVETSEDD